MSDTTPESIGRLFRRISLPLAAGAALNQLNRAITAVIGLPFAYAIYRAASRGVRAAARIVYLLPIAVPP
ncbi:MAG: hypothetical protein ACK4ST_04445, partial [Elioraea tepidiphila]